VQNTSKLKIAIVAGESSGDLLGSDLLQSFRTNFPNAEFRGIAGPAMQELGCESLYAMEELSVIGIWAILKRLPRLLKMRKKLAEQIIDWQPDLFIGIDAPEFNLGLEVKLKAQGINTVHYVSPSVWAWREKRIFKIKTGVDYMLTLFPFETAIYNQHDIPVSCVGHPLAKMLPLEPETAAARQALGLSESSKVLAMLPGSRGSEIKYLGQLFIETAVRLKSQQPDLQIVVPLINERRRAQFTQLIEATAPDLDIILIDKRSREVMCAADAIMLASGTATLEAMLLKKPMLVAYKVSAFSYAIYSRLIKLQYFSLPNLLTKAPMVPELIQDDATVDNLTKEISNQLKSGLPENQLNEYISIHNALRLGAGEKAVNDLTKHFSLS
jgi:lipid-A-disaccharide synthase